MTKIIEYRNQFHESVVRVRAAVNRVVDDPINKLRVRLSAGQIRRVQRTLCSVPGCVCGGLSDFLPIGYPGDAGWCYGGRVVR